MKDKMFIFRRAEQQLEVDNFINPTTNSKMKSYEHSNQATRRPTALTSRES